MSTHRFTSYSPRIVIRLEKARRRGGSGRASFPRAGVVEWVHLELRKEAGMTIEKTIRKKIVSIEGQLTRRVRSLEKDVSKLVKKVEKKENEVKKLKDKLTSRFVKGIKKNVKKAKKAVRKSLPKIG